MYDCIVIGGGPAGLTAAIYLARFHLKVLVLHHDKSRAATIPLTRNHAGFPEGLQAHQCGAMVQISEVMSIERDAAGFAVTTKQDVFKAKTVLLATGVINNRPEMPSETHDVAVAQGLIRYCPICDGYEVTDKAVGVLGTGDRGFNEAMFLRSFTSRVSLIAEGRSHELSDKQKAQLETNGIDLHVGPASGFMLNDDSSITVDSPGGSLTYASIYPALGSVVRSELVVGLNAKRTDAGCVEVDRHQRTSVRGLYAAGDVVLGLDQISHAMGQASVAATAIRNDLNDEAILVRG
jgi:thioredoxin reductase (NADPH)